MKKGGKDFNQWGEGDRERERVRARESESYSVGGRGAL